LNTITISNLQVLNKLTPLKATRKQKTPLILWELVLRQKKTTIPNNKIWTIFTVRIHISMNSSVFCVCSLMQWIHDFFFLFIMYLKRQISQNWWPVISRQSEWTKAKFATQSHGIMREPPLKQILHLFWFWLLLLSILAIILCFDFIFFCTFPKKFLSFNWKKKPKYIVIRGHELKMFGFFVWSNLCLAHKLWNYNKIILSLVTNCY
jgi:hypothetical protein